MTPKLFSASLNDYAEEFKKYLPVNINLRYETLSPDLASCENAYIVPLLGENMFNSLVTYYESRIQDNPAAVDEVLEKLLELVQFALIRLAPWKGFDVIANLISDTGFSSQIEKDNRLYRYQEENIKNSLRNEGFDTLDAVLAHLEKNLDNPSVSAFADSQYHLKRDHTLIKDTAAFNECYDINNSRLVFLKMSQFVYDAEHINLCHRIGETFYNELLTADESVEKYASILPNLRRAVVYCAIAEGIGELHKMPTDKGLLFHSSSDAEGYNESPVDQKELAATRMQFAQKSDRYLSAVISHIADNISDYPNFSTFSEDSPVDGIIRINNDNRSIFVI